MLRTSGLAKTYGIKETAVKALKPTDLEIQEGEFVAVVGPSGSGKSTLLHLIAGIDKPSAGKVFINDQDIYELSENELSRYRRQNIGFIFQAFNLIPILSAEENIKLPVLMDEILENEVNRMTKTLYDPEVEKRGIEKGIAEGIEKGKAELLIKLLIKKFKSLPEGYENKIMNLSIDNIDRISMDIFDINSVEELEAYFKFPKV